MCTIVVATRVWEDAPLVVAANRDELLARPAEGPRRRRFAPEGREVFAPRDLEAGGTWLGFAPGPLFVGLTNRAAAPDPSKRSRGALVAEALEHPTVESARAWADSVQVERYNPFHLLVADASSAFLLWPGADGGRGEIIDLPPGLHVVTERYATRLAGPAGRARPTRRPELVRERTAGWTNEASAPASQRWLELLATTSAEGDAMEGISVRSPDGRYGTRSASVLRLTRPADAPYVAAVEPELVWVEGPPGRVEPVDLSEALRDVVAPKR